MSHFARFHEHPEVMAPLYESPNAMRPFIHMILHFVIPALVARTWYLGRWRWAFLVMVGTMVVDIDHLLADPIYDPNRCGIGFHPLHSYPAIAVYLLLLAIPWETWLRMVALGLVIHMFLDGVDCLWMRLDSPPLF